MHRCAPWSLCPDVDSIAVDLGSDVGLRGPPAVRPYLLQFVVVGMDVGVLTSGVHSMDLSVSGVHLAA